MGFAGRMLISVLRCPRGAWGPACAQHSPYLLCGAGAGGGGEHTGRSGLRPVAKQHLRRHSAHLTHAVVHA